jgi:hypothetical protein
VFDVYEGWCEALTELGQDVYRFNLDDRLAFYDHALIDIGEELPDGRLKLRKALDADGVYELALNGLAAALWKIRPDYLLIISGFFVPHDMLDHARRQGTRIVVVHTEQPYELERELALATHADANLINDPTHIEKFRAVAPTWYCPHAYRPGLHKPGEPDPKLAADLAFVGTGFGSRRWFFEHMDLKGLDVLLAGNWNGVTENSPLWQYLASGDPEKCVDNAETVRIYQSAKVGINLYRREADDDQVVGGWSISPREIEMAACGLFFLRDPRPEGDHLLHMLPVFSSPEEATWLLRYWLDKPEERHKAAQQAREAVADRTFTAHAKHLLRLLETKE